MTQSIAYSVERRAFRSYLPATRYPLVALLVLTVLMGCGYSTGRLLSAEHRAIYIEPFQNQIPITEEVSEQHGFQTNLPRLEERVTRGVIDQFLLDGNLRVTTEPKAADLVLGGIVQDFFRQPLRRLDDNTVEEYRLNLGARLTLRDKKGTLLWKETRLIGDTTYFVSGASAISESTAVDNLITDFSRRVVERVIENW